MGFSFPFDICFVFGILWSSSHFSHFRKSFLPSIVSYPGFDPFPYIINILFSSFSFSSLLVLLLLPPHHPFTVYFNLFEGLFFFVASIFVFSILPSFYQFVACFALHQLRILRNNTKI